MPKLCLLFSPINVKYLRLTSSLPVRLATKSALRLFTEPCRPSSKQSRFTTLEPGGGKKLVTLRATFLCNVQHPLQSSRISSALGSGDHDVMMKCGQRRSTSAEREHNTPQNLDNLYKIIAINIPQINNQCNLQCAHIVL